MVSSKTIPTMNFIDLLVQARRSLRCPELAGRDPRVKEESLHARNLLRRHGSYVYSLFGLLHVH